MYPFEEETGILPKLNENTLKRMLSEYHRQPPPDSSPEEKTEPRQQNIHKQKELEEQQEKRRERVRSSILCFMKECSALRFAPKERTPSALLYEVYCRWCQENILLPETLRSFGLHLKANAHKYQIAPTNFTWQGRHIRGYRGIGVLEEASHTSHT